MWKLCCGYWPCLGCGNWPRLSGAGYSPSGLSLHRLVYCFWSRTIRTVSKVCFVSWRGIAFSREDMRPPAVVAVDLGSKDQTPAILRRLATEYSFLHFRTMTEEQLAAEILPELSLGVLVLDLRVLSAKQALEAARWLLQKRPSGKAKDRPAQEASF